MISLAIAFLVLALIVALIPRSAQLPQRAELPAWVHAGSALLALGAAALAGYIAAAPGAAIQVLVLVIAIIVAAAGGSPVVVGAFSVAHREAVRQRRTDVARAARHGQEEPAAPADAESDAPSADNPGPLRGGFTIGILERIAVAVSILTAWPQGIAIVMAVKGLARYPELRHPDAGEQFIIGTAASVLWAAAVSGTAYLIIT